MTKRTACETPYEVASYLLKRYVFKTTRDTETIYVYNSKDGIYEDKAGAMIRAEAQEVLGKSATSYKVNEAISIIQRKTYVDRTEFDNDPYRINVSNGHVMLKTHELVPHSPDTLSLSKLNIHYNPKADCPAIKKFLSEIVCPDDVALLQQFFGYLLCRHYRYHRAFLLTGEGWNGKTTLLDLMQTFIGKQSCSSVPLQGLSGRFDHAQLFGKLANICDDIPSNPVKEAGKLKQLTGESRIMAERKHEHPFEFTNTAKLIFSCNQIPSADGADDAYYSRWVIVDFPNTFKRGVNADTDLLSKLTTKDELSGLLNFALEGVKLLEDAGGFSVEDDHKTARERYLSCLGDSIGKFVNQVVVFDKDAKTSKKELYGKYCEFCWSYDMTAKELNAFYRALDDRYHTKDMEYYAAMPNSERIYILKGIRTKESF